MFNSRNPKSVLVGVFILLSASMQAAGAGTESNPPAAPSFQKSSSQDFPGGKRGGGRFMPDVGLSQQQQSQVEQIMKNFRDKMRSLREDTDKQLKGVMTPEQFSKYQQSRPHGPGGFGGAGGPEGPGGAGGRMGGRNRRMWQGRSGGAGDSGPGGPPDDMGPPGTGPGPAPGSR